MVLEPRTLLRGQPPGDVSVDQLVLGGQELVEGAGGAEVLALEPLLLALRELAQQVAGHQPTVTRRRHQASPPVVRLASPAPRRAREGISISPGAEGPRRRRTQASSR